MTPKPFLLRHGHEQDDLDQFFKDHDEPTLDLAKPLTQDDEDDQQEGFGAVAWMFLFVALALSAGIAGIVYSVTH